MPHRIGIVADDLTGAADALAPFRARGYDCELLLDPERDSSAAVTATVTHCRALPADRAGERTRIAVAQVLAEGRRPYVKIDSTMRGPVGAQLDGALAAAHALDPRAHVVVCPAYPEMGRIVRDGVVYVDGVPLGESVFTSDPRNPVRVSTMGDLLPGAVRCEPATVAAAGPIAYADGTGGDDLDALVAAALVHPGVLLAGSAGLAAAWARALPDLSGPETPWTPPAHVLLVATSRHPVTLAQIDHLPADLFSALGEREDDIAAVGPVTVLTAPARFTPYDADRVLESMARQAAAFFETEDVHQLILIGGDGAAAVLRALGARAISLRPARMAGHAEGVIRGGVADGIAVTTRAGGFGSTATLFELLRLTLAA